MKKMMTGVLALVMVLVMVGCGQKDNGVVNGVAKDGATIGEGAKSFTTEVVDKDGDLTGVVTADALLRVCMPDYLLWMDDLSPILLFEPFVNVLRNEESTWLAEILHQEFSAVQVDQPAIAVAEAMTKRNASACYIVKEKKLLGVITLPHFLNKVLRD